MRWSMSRTGQGLAGHLHIPSSQRRQSFSDWVHSTTRAVRFEGAVKVGPGSKPVEEVQTSESVETLDLLVQQGSYVPASLFYYILRRCTAQKDLTGGRRVDGVTVKCGYESNPYLANHIMRMYASHGRLQEATQVFMRLSAPSTHMWFSIILAHSEHNQPVTAIELYRQMLGSTVKPNNYVYVAVLKACANAPDLASGKEVHADILGNAVKPDIFVSNCLVDMYATCGSLDDARRVFDSLPMKDVVTWNALISGYAQHGLGQEALALYASMQQEGVNHANRVTFVSLLKACSSVGALDQGRQLHSHIQQLGLEADVVVGSSLVDMYSKCGSLEDAWKVFDRLPKRNVVTWNALLNGCCHHNDGEMAIQFFEQMQENGVEPNEATFVCLLMACSHEGLVDEGQGYFKMMVEEYNIVPTGHHYACMVDLLGRSGHLREAETMLQRLPSENEVVGWTSLLNACKSFSDVERARRCFDRLTQLEPQYSAAYVLLASMYASANMWQDVDRIERLRKVAGASKKPARAWIEVNSRVHAFVVGEERDDTSSKLRSMNLCLEVNGRILDSSSEPKEASVRDKNDALCGHAEKLALAYGLLNTKDGTTLIVTKNLRMCNDCHNGTKSMSRIEQRQIIVRDAHRVHHFVNGCCSCGDRHY